MVDHPYKIWRGSRESRRCRGFNKVGDDVVNQIAEHLDTKSTIQLAAYSKELHRQVIGGEGYSCPNYNFSEVVSFNKLYTHMISCIHSPFICMEPGCNCVGNKLTLYLHLKSTHSIEVPTILYSVKQWDPSKLVPIGCSRRTNFIGIGKTGMLFIGQIHGHNTEIVLSVNHVRSATWELEDYEVRISSLVDFCWFYPLEFDSEPKIGRPPAEATLEALNHYLSIPGTYCQAPQLLVGGPRGVPMLDQRQHQPIIPFAIGVVEMAGKIHEFYIYLAKSEQVKAYYEDPQTTVKREKRARRETSATRPRP